MTLRPFPSVMASRGGSSMTVLRITLSLFTIKRDDWRASVRFPVLWHVLELVHLSVPTVTLDGPAGAGSSRIVFQSYLPQSLGPCRRAWHESRFVGYSALSDESALSFRVSAIVRCTL